VIAHPDLGAVICVGVAVRDHTGVGPPLLGVLVRFATQAEFESPWHDPEYVQVLLDQGDMR